MRFENIQDKEDLKNFFIDNGFEIQKYDENLIKIDKSHFLQIKIVDILDHDVASKEHKEFKKKFRDVQYQLLIDKNFQKFIFQRDYGTPIRFTYDKTKHYARETEGSILKKLNSLKFDDGDFNTTMNNLFDVKEIVNKFYEEYKRIRKKLANAIKNLDGDTDLYAQVIMDRIIFLYFLQAKEILPKYFLTNLYYNKKRTENFYRDYLVPLFFQMLNTEKHSEELVRKFGSVPYLNGGLFSPKDIEIKNGNVQISDGIWDDVFTLLNGYEWVIEEEKGDSTTLTPSILGHIYEKSVIAATQKETGSYYTPEEITTYISKNTIYPYITDRINEKFRTNYKNIWNELLDKTKHNEKEIEQVKFIYFDLLKNLKICDNACGSGAFLIAAQQILLPIYWACIKILLNKPFFREELSKLKKYRNWNYFLKKEIITKNLYGVDIQEGAVEIAKLRLWLSMVSEMELKVEDIEPLPNIDYNLLVGNSLIGYIKLPEKWGSTLFDDPNKIKKLLEERQKLINIYRETRSSKEAKQLEEDIEKINKKIREELNEMLLNELKSKKIEITKEEFLKLKPFHWVFEFYDVFNGKKKDDEKGFDIIIGNPPWNAVKPVEKEFFCDYDARLTKYGVDKIEARKIIKKLLENRKIRESWEEYKRKIELEAKYYGNSYEYQSDEINGKKVGGDLNYYKIFLERTYQLVRLKGFVGYIIPSGFHTDAGTKGLRKLFFDEGKVFSLINFENRKRIFQGIDIRFKFDLLTSQKFGFTNFFYGRFMLHDVGILKHIPEKALKLEWNLMKKISPESFSITEFKSQKDVEIANKICKHPTLKDNRWLGKVELFTEFHMTNDSNLFNTEKKGLPLYEGKMIEQYTPYFEKNRFWIEESKGIEKIYGNVEKRTNFDFRHYRLGFRAVASSTNRRSMIATILPKNVFCGNSIIVVKIFNKNDERNITEDKLLYLCAVFNSFVFDYFLRLKITTNINMFFIYQMPIPLPKKEEFNEIIKNVLLLTENWEEFDELRKKFCINGRKLNQEDRLEIISNIDVIIGKLYGLEKDDMKYILSKFHHKNPDIENELRILEKLILGKW